METLWRDIRFAFRSLLKSPGFTLAALLCLSLGIGASSAIFSVVRTVLLEPLPYRQPENLMLVWGHFLAQEVPRSPLSALEYLDLREQNQVFEGVAALAPQPVSYTSEGEPQQLLAGRTSASLFPVLGVTPFLGRVFTPEEDRFGNNRVVLLTYGAWRERFGGDESIVGKAVTLDGNPHTVVGVLPEDFSFGVTPYDVWLPQGLNIEKLPPRQIRFMTIVGRLKPGVSAERAQAEMDVIAQRFQRDEPEVYPADSGWGLHLVEAREDLVGEVRTPLLVLFGAVGLVLIIACANVANLLLARASTRNKEVAIRTAIGASRNGLVRQFLTEGLLLSLLGAGFGLLFAFAATKLMVAYNPGNIPRLDKVAVDAGSLLFALAIAVVTGVVFGLVPAVHVSNRKLRETLQEGGKTSGAGAAGQRLRSGLVMLEIALALVVLIGAGLMLKSFRRLLDVNPGFRTDNVLTLQVSLPRMKYPEDPQLVSFGRELLENVRRLPGVESAALSSQLPMGGMDLSGDIVVDGKPYGISEPAPTTGWRIVTPGYFEAMGIPLRQGRLFQETDDERAVQSVIIDEELARRLWPGESPLGKRLRLNARTPELSDWRTIVGVVGHVRQRGLDEAASDQLYVPMPQYPVRLLHLVLRSSSSPESLAKPVREAVWALDRDLPVIDLQTMEDRVYLSLTRPRFNTFLLVAFAATALALTIVGVYGVMAYSVAQRTRDLGVRVALGAQKRDVLRLVLGQGLAVTLTGLLVGLVVAWSLSRLLVSLLYGVEATDAATFAGVSILLGGLALAASYFPARRAAKVDPLVALRYE